MVTIVVCCRYCGKPEAVRRKGISTTGHQPHRRTGYHCENCKRTFQLGYSKRAYEPGVKEHIIDMALNGSGIRDTARVLRINMNTVMSTIKKSPNRRLGKPGLQAY
jgi:transposase-like protein